MPKRQAVPPVAKASYPSHQAFEELIIAYGDENSEGKECTAKGTIRKYGKENRRSLVDRPELHKEHRHVAGFGCLY